MFSFGSGAPLDRTGKGGGEGGGGGVVVVAALRSKPLSYLGKALYKYDKYVLLKFKPCFFLDKISLLTFWSYKKIISSRCKKCFAKRL